MTGIVIGFLIITTNFLYRRRGMRMYRFCHCMVVSETFRKDFSLLLLALLTIYNSVYALAFLCESDRIFAKEDRPVAVCLAITTVLMMFLARQHCLLGLLKTIRNSRQLIVVSAIVIVGMLCFPYMENLTVTLAVILVAAFFYPGQKIMHSINDRRQYASRQHMLDSFFNDYFA